MALDARINIGLLAALEKIIELPSNLIELDLHMAVDDITTVTCADAGAKHTATTQATEYERTRSDTA